MTSKPKILFLINSLAGGGAERVLLSLLAGSRELQARYDFELALLDDEPRGYAPPDWLIVHQFNAKGSLVRSVRALDGHVRKYRPALVLSFLTRANIANVLVSKLRGHATIISERVATSSHLTGGLGARVASQLVRLTYPRADRVIAVSQGIADDLTANFGLRTNRIEVIANPVDGDAIRAAGAASVERPFPGPYIVAVSRLTRTKNPILCVEALARSSMPCGLVLLGQGPEREAILRRVHELGLADRVVLPGFAANPFAIMRQADFYVSASNAEGFPNGLVEAMALGLPVISTNCASGPSEILAETDREAITGLTLAPHGILVPTNDATALADAMRIYADPTQRSLYGSRSMQRATAFAPEHARAAYWQQVDDTLTRRKA